MTVHSASSSIELDSGILLAAPGLRNGISAQSDLHFFLNANWISSESNLLVTVSASASVYPPLTFLDGEGNPITKIMFESVYPGRKTGTQTITAVNKTDSTLTITLSSIEGISQTGYEVDTYGSLRFSDDDDIYYETLTLEIPANDSLDFYIYYNPPSTAKIGEKEWAINVLPSSLPEWLYFNQFNVTNNDDEQLTDIIISVTIPYTAGKMQTDFGDIRFYTEAEELESSIDYKIDSSYAVFTVKIPVIDVDETITVYVWGGNAYADDNDDNVFTENWNWLDGTLDPWVNVGGTAGSGMASVIYDAIYGHDVMEIYNTGGFPEPRVETPSTGVYGRWTVRFCFGSTSFAHSNRIYFEYYFIHDGTNYYKIRFDTYNSPNTIKLYYNTTLLDSSKYSPDLNIHILSITRNMAGEISVSIDGTEYLSATEATITTCTKIQFYMDTALSPSQRAVLIDYIHFIEELETPPSIGSLGSWENRLDLECYGGILYVSRELPELEPEITYRCKIEETYYE